MFKKFTKKRVLATLSMVTLATLMVQAYVLAQPTSAPPGGNIDATFDNVGVGNSSPTERLVVGEDLGEVNTSESIVVGVTNPSTGAPGITLGESANDNARINWSNSLNALMMYTKNGGVSNGSQLVLSNNGNVGIGTSTPYTDFQVGSTSTDQFSSFKTNHPDNMAIVDDASSSSPAIWLGKSTLQHSEIIYENPDAYGSKLYLTGTYNSSTPRNFLTMQAGAGTDSNLAGFNTANPTTPLDVLSGTNYSGYIARFINDQYSSGKGLYIQSGGLTGINANSIIQFVNKNGTPLGGVYHDNTAVNYANFTGSHEVNLSSNTYEYGTIISADNITTDKNSSQPTYSGKSSNKPYDNRILGVYATDIENSDKSLINAVGDGHVLVTTENGSIKAGDPITSSNAAGLGMKATEAGTILGYALEDWDGSQSVRTETLADGTEVKVGLVAVYYYPGTKYTPDQATQIQNLQDQINTQNEVIAELREAIDSLK